MLVVLICIWRIVLLIIITIFFSPMNSREVGYPDAQCASAQGCYIQNREYLKFVYHLNQLRLIWIFTWKRNFAKIDYFFGIFCDTYVSKFSPLFHIAQLLFLRKWTQWLGYIHFFSLFIGPKTSLYGLKTSLVGQRTLHWKNHDILNFGSQF